MTDIDRKMSWRECLLRDKSFLKSLYCSNALSNKTTLGFATRDELSTLLKVLYCLVKGEIPIKKIHYESLIRSKKAKLLHSRLSSMTKLKQVKENYQYIVT